KQISDGTSKTYLIGEKSVQPKCYTGVGGNMCPADNGSVYEGHDWDVIRWTYRDSDATNSGANTRDWRPLKDEDHATSESNAWGNGDQWGETNFGSQHSAGCFFAMCDGSVQTISYSVDQKVNYNLSNRKDGNSVQLP